MTASPVVEHFNVIEDTGQRVAIVTNNFRGTVLIQVLNAWRALQPAHRFRAKIKIGAAGCKQAERDGPKPMPCLQVYFYHQGSPELVRNNPDILAAVVLRTMQNYLLQTEEKIKTVDKNHTSGVSG